MLNYALRLLAGREHSTYELQTKLKNKGLNSEEIEQVITECQRLGLQCDKRFAELICRARIRQGYGSMRIMQELKSKKVEADIIYSVLNEQDIDWLDAVQKVWEKKFSRLNKMSLADLQKQQRFLMYRGFPSDIISSFFKEKGSADLREE